MKNCSRPSSFFRSSSLLCGLAATSILWCVNPAQATVIVNENFNSLSADNLNGQGGWALLTGITSAPQVTTGVGINTTKVVGQATTGTTAAVARNTSYFSAGTLTGSETAVTLTFDVYADVGGSIEFFGIGGTYGSGYSPSAQFGIMSGNWAVRGENYGTISNPVNSSNVILTPTLDKWYSVQSVWNLSSGTVTLAIKNLTDGETSYTPLYFNAAQTQSTVAMSFTNISSWNSAYVRSSNSSNGAGYLDNLHVDTVPEPSGATLGLFSLAIFVALRRFSAGRRASLRS